jgi:hypothetical protein
MDEWRRVGSYTNRSNDVRSRGVHMESLERLVAPRLGSSQGGEEREREPPNQGSLCQKYLGCYEIGFEYWTSIWCNSKSLFIHPSLGLSEALSGRRISRFVPQYGEVDTVKVNTEEISPFFVEKYYPTTNYQ